MRSMAVAGVLVVLCGCRGGSELSESKALDALKSSREFMAPLAVNVCGENRVSWGESSVFRPADPVGVFLTKESAGKTLKALVTLGLIDITPAGATVRARLTEKGRGLAKEPTRDGCGLNGMEDTLGKPRWAFAVAENGSVDVLAVEMGPAADTPRRARVKVRSGARTLTSLGKELSGVAPHLHLDRLGTEPAEATVTMYQRGEVWRLE